MKVGRKSTGRNVEIYPRIQKVNRSWLSKAAKFTGCKSENEFIDKLFTTLRRENKLKWLKAEIAKRVEIRASEG